MPENFEEKYILPQENEEKYSSEAIREDIKFKAQKIRNWAQQMGFEDKKDFLVIECITEIEKETSSIAPHELKEFFVGMREDHYKQFIKYIAGQYTKERKKENPNNKYGGPKLDYSWGGRFAIIGDGVTVDTVAVSDLEKLVVPTHHKAFKEFFKEKALFDFPTSETLNPILKEMSAKGLETYKAALERLKIMGDQGTLPDDGYGLIDEMERAVMILKDAKNGDALSDLPELLVGGKMEAKIRHYADLTYNAEDLKDLDRVSEITGIFIPNEVRIEKIFDRFDFDRRQMENICKDFANALWLKDN